MQLEDVALHFNLKTQEAIDRIQNIQEMGRLTGICFMSVILANLVSLFVYVTACIRSLVVLGAFQLRTMSAVGVFSEGAMTVYNVHLHTIIDVFFPQFSGVMDDRGKFIYISEEELKNVAKFIRQRGRISITELAESSNTLIKLQKEKEKPKEPSSNLVDVSA